MEKKILALGATGKDDPNVLTVDSNAKLSPDVVHDLNQVPWPFKDNQFDSIICHHVLEHLNNFSAAMRELYRICGKAGEIYIELPHHSSYHASSPDHKMRFHYFSFDRYLDTGKKNPWITAEERFKLVERKITFHKSFRRIFLHKLFNRCPLSYERFWAYIFPAEHLVLRLQPIK